MKKKKALLALIVVAIVASIGALGYLALSYFSSSARSSNAGGELSIDYLVSEKDVVEEDTQSDSSKNIFQWLKERLSADKAQEEVTLQTETSGPSNTQSGMSQSIRQSEDEEETDLNPVQQAVKDAQQTNTNKKKDDQTDDTPTEDTNTQPEQPAQEDTKKNPEDEPPQEGEHKVFISIRCDTAVDKGMTRSGRASSRRAARFWRKRRWNFRRATRSLTCCAVSATPIKSTSPTAAPTARSMSTASTTSMNLTAAGGRAGCTASTTGTPTTAADSMRSKTAT